MSFDQFSINPKCLSVLKRQGITEPTPVQAEAVPIALEGRDVLAVAQTGTGKTLAFALPSVTRIAELKRGKSHMLVLTPTRELAVQVHAVIEPLGRALGLRSQCVYGGVSMEPQSKALRRGVDIIIATPGRLLDHIRRRNARLNNLDVLVMDEADRMLDMGFLPDIRAILSELPEDRQTLLFSATFPSEISRLTKEFMYEPKRIEIGAIATPVDTVNQCVYTVDNARKTGLLADILGQDEVQSAIVFVRTKHRTDRIAAQLNKKGFKVQAIHGGRSQSQRQKALDGFRKGKFKVLIATDVAARGIDVQGITHVINFDTPRTFDDYVHRIGRTARNEAKGEAVTFVTPQDTKDLGAIESGLKKKLPQHDWEGAVRVPSLYREGPPAKKGRSKKSSFRGRRPRRRTARSVA